jgi:hypothetical protein
MMVHALATSAIFVALLAGGRAPARAPQAASIPLNIAVTATPGELTAGATAHVEVKLRNYLGNPVPAPVNIVVTLHSELSGDASIAIKAGQSEGETEVRFIRPGVANLVATAANMTSGSAAVVVKAEMPAQADASAVAGPPAAPRPGPTAAPLPPAPLRQAASEQRVKLAIDVLPDHVHPSNSVWTAKVLVTAVDANRQPIPVRSATSVQLSTDAGLISPAAVTIEPGHARASGQIQVTSNKAGAGTIWAWTDDGDLYRAGVEYHSPTATQLTVKALPTRTINDGRTAINVTVFLQDEGAGYVKAEEDVLVKLTSTIGTLKPSTLSVPKGQFVGEAVLTSATAGVAEITASGAGVRSGLTTVEFVFPYLLVACAALGGLVGALVRSSGETYKGAWWWHLSHSLAIGTVLGLVFYLLAVFGIIASIPKIPLPLDQMPTSNELVAIILGFFGGYWARAWVPNPGSAAAAKRTEPEHA